jgi:flavin-binding protein dodecin
MTTGKKNGNPRIVQLGSILMAVAKVIEISASSTQNFEHAIKTGIEHATKTLNDVRGAWVKEQQIIVTDQQVSEYRVNLLVTFVLEA